MEKVKVNIEDKFGSYQKKVLVLGFFLTIPNGLFTMASVFASFSPQFSCNLTSNISKVPDDECSQYNTTLLVDGHVEATNETISCQNGWIYYSHRGETSIVTEFDLVCENAWLKPFTTSLYLLGVLIGSFFGGPISDRFGRRKVVIISLFGSSLSRIMCGISQSPLMFSVFFFTCGTFALVKYITGFLLITESISNSKRALAGTIFACGFAVGYMVLPLLAYIFTSWRWLCIVIGLVGMAQIPVLWCMLTESPLWLAACGKTEKAKKIFAKMYEVDEGSTELENMLPKNSKDDEGDKEDNKMSLNSLLMLITVPSFRTRTLVMYAVWFTSAMTYYCISLATSDMGGDKYINCFIAAAIEIPAYLFSLVIIEKIGRRSMMVLSLLATGIACAMAPFIGQSSAIGLVVFAMISKFIITGIFSVAYIYSSELFPTLLRNTSIGITSTVARVGAMIAPYLIFAGDKVGASVPYLIMGGFCIFSAFLCILLPETKSVPLPNNVEEAIALDKHKLQLKCRQR